MNRHKLYWGLFASIALAIALTGVVDRTGQSYADEALRRALVTFAVARTLNGLISVAQGTEVAVEPGGVGLNFTPGQALDPINDLVERFSVVMLVATSSVALQIFLLRITTWWGTTLALGIITAVTLLALWRPHLVRLFPEARAVRWLLMVVFIRFAVPVFLIGSNVVFDAFLAAEQQAASQALAMTNQELEELTEDAADEEQSVLERLGAVVDDSLDTLDVQGRLERLRLVLSDSTEHIINLIVIFALQTILLPLGFLWLFAEFLKRLATRTTALPTS